MIVLAFLGKVILAALAIILTYTLLTLLGTVIPVNTSYRNMIDGVEIAISSNGVHTDFILPTANELFDWRGIVNEKDYGMPLSAESFLGIGWGDRGFYLDTPTWAELKAKTAIVAVMIPSPTLMHVTAHEAPPQDSKFFVRLFLSHEQYLALCGYILGFFEKENDDVKLIPDVGYTPNDNFYHAIGAYHAFNTCNFWVNKGLIKAGVRTALWSPLDRGIFFQLEKIKSVS